MNLRLGRWPGCHGVRADDPTSTFDLGHAIGDPLATATIAVGPVAAPDRGDSRLWDVHAEADLGDRTISVDRTLYRRPDGTRLLTATRGPALSVDLTAARIAVEPGDVAVQLQLLATLALPMFAIRGGAVMLHASACARDGRAVIVCGDSGAGKSSILAGLVDAGWQAVSEDMCALDVTADPPLVWPGPPWVRLAHGRPAPAGAVPRFETPDKTAWDIAPRQVVAATPVATLVFLERPGGSQAQTHPIPPANGVRLLATHAVWLGDPEERGPQLFGPLLDLAHLAPGVGLRLPLDPSWLARIPDLFAEIA